MIWPGKGADVGPAVASDLCLVAHSTQRQADEIAPGRAGNRSRQRGLSGSGWPHKTQDGAGGLPHELANREKLEDPVFDLFEAVVVFVEDLLGPGDITNLPRSFDPWHRQ